MFVIEIKFWCIGFLVWVVVVVMGVEFKFDLFEKILWVIFNWMVCIMVKLNVFFNVVFGLNVV